MNLPLHDTDFPRSARRGVRNPVLLLPAASRLLALPASERRLLGLLFREIAREADLRAERAWKKRKGPMAAYWRATCTYAKHIARAIDPGRRRPR
jgi:hypothetical protein